MSEVEVHKLKASVWLVLLSQTYKKCCFGNTDFQSTLICVQSTLICAQIRQVKIFSLIFCIYQSRTIINYFLFLDIICQRHNVYTRVADHPKHTYRSDKHHAKA
jgi:hypothetical protein